MALQSSEENRIEKMLLTDGQWHLISTDDK